MTTRDFAHKKHLLNLKELFRYTWPPLFASIGSVALGITDSLLIAHYSSSALAGVALGASLYELPVNVLLGGLMAYRILAPRLPPRQDGGLETFGLKAVLRRLIPISGLLAFAALALSLYGSATLTGATWSTAFSYLAGRSVSLVTEILGSALAIALVAWGRTRAPLIVFLISAPSNIVLDFLLVYGLGPIPELGALGAGVGSTVSTLLPLLYLIVVVTRNRTHEVPSSAVHKNYAKWPKLAWPAAGSALVDYGGNVVFTIILAFSGTSALAGMRFGVQAHLLAFVFVSTASSSALYILGRFYTEDPDTIRDGSREVRKVFFFIGVCTGFIVLVCGLAVSPYLSPDPVVVQSFRISVAVVAALCPLAGLTYGNVTLLRLFGFTNLEFMSNALGVWCAQIPLSLLFGILFGEVFPFFGLAAYWVLRCALSQLQVSSHVLRKRKVDSANPYS